MEYVTVTTEQLQEWLHVAMEEGKDGLDLFDTWAVSALAEYGVEQAPVRPRVALIALTVASILFLYSLFMVLLGVFLARVFGKSGVRRPLSRCGGDAYRGGEGELCETEAKSCWPACIQLCVYVRRRHRREREGER